MKKIILITSIVLLASSCSRQQATTVPPAQNPTANWQTYSDNNSDLLLSDIHNGFSFKYPTDWTIRTDENPRALLEIYDANASATLQNCLKNPPKLPYSNVLSDCGQEAGNAQMYIFPDSYVDYTNLDPFLKANYPDYKQVTISGLDVFSYTGGNDNPSNFYYHINTPDKKSGLYLVSYPNGDLTKTDQQILGQVVNTFTFTAAISSNLTTYTSPTKYGFSLQYPSGFGFSTDLQQVQGVSYIPVCDQDMVACAYLVRDTFKATNFDGAGVSVNIDETLNTEAKCYNFAVPTNAAQTPEPDAIINGVAFKFFTGGDGAAGHFDNSKIYRNFHNNMCYEIAAHVGSTNIDNYPAGTISQFDETAVWQKLQGVVNSFSFTK